MTLPGNVLPLVAPSLALLDPDTLGRPLRTRDYELGGVALQDATQGLMVRQWVASLVGEQIRVYPRDDEAAFIVLTTVPGVTELSLAFDQNMNPMVAYVALAQAKLYWYDATIPGYTTLTLGVDARSPYLTADDKRPMATSENRNDVLLFYVKGNRLFYRQQRDRFLTERGLQWLDGGGVTIRRAGMSNRLRVQVELVGLQAGLAVGAVIGTARDAVYQIGVTSIALAMPVGLETGDLLYAVLMHRAAVTPPAGWTLVTSQACAAGATTQTLSVFKKTTAAPGDSGVSVTFTQSASERMGLGYFAVRGTTGTTPTYIGASAVRVDDLATNTVTAPSAAAAAVSLVVMVATSINAGAAVTRPGVAAGVEIISGSASQTRLGVAYQRRKVGQTNAGRFTFDNGTPANNGLAAITLRFGNT